MKRVLKLVLPGVLASQFLLISCLRDQQHEHPAVKAKIEPFHAESRFHAGQKITFSNISENGTTYLWDFGDGSFSSDSVPIHTYTEKGIYEVTLAVSNPGNSTISKLTVEVNDSLLSLLTNNSAKEWYLYKIKDGAYTEANIDSSCFCNYAQIFYKNFQHEWSNQGALYCDNDTINCNATGVGKFEVVNEADNNNDAIMIGPGKWMSGFKIELTEHELILEDIGGVKTYYTTKK